jgi:hypothetical protein
MVDGLEHHVISEHTALAVCYQHELRISSWQPPSMS